MASYMNAILMLAFSEFKLLVLLQLSNMVDEEATQTTECSLLFPHFVPVFHWVRVRVRVTKSRF